MKRGYYIATLDDGTEIDLDGIMIMGQDIYFGKYSAKMSDNEKKRIANEIREIMNGERLSDDAIARASSEKKLSGVEGISHDVPAHDDAKWFDGGKR